MSTREAKRVALLEAARDVILRYGYKKATLEDVAQETGVSRATVYNYFGNKEELFRSIIEMEIERLRLAMAGRMDLAAPPEVQMRTMIEARYAHLRELRTLYRVVLDVARDVMPVALKEMEAFKAEQLAWLGGLIQAGVDSGRFRPVDAEVLAAAILAALEGLDQGFFFEDRDALEQGAVCLVDTLLCGLLVEDA